MRKFIWSDLTIGTRIVNGAGKTISQKTRVDTSLGPYVAGVIEIDDRMSVGIWHPDTLFVAPTKKVGWIGLYSMGGLSMGRIGHTSGGIYETEEGARFSCKSASLFVKIEWEE